MLVVQITVDGGNVAVAIVSLTAVKLNVVGYEVNGVAPHGVGGVELAYVHFCIEYKLPDKIDVIEWTIEPELSVGLPRNAVGEGGDVAVDEVYVGAYALYVEVNVTRT